MTSAERRQLAQQMSQLLNVLMKYSEVAHFRDLPKELQTELSHLPLIGPITSSGLERTESLVNRIDFVIYGLLSPQYEIINNRFVSKSTPQQESTQTSNVNTDKVASTMKQIPITKSATRPTPSPKQQPLEKQAPQSASLDFGPFDPRKGQR